MKNHSSSERAYRVSTRVSESEVAGALHPPCSGQLGGWFGWISRGGACGDGAAGAGGNEFPGSSSLVVAGVIGCRFECLLGCLVCWRGS